jgi:hypothetical protein
MKYLMTGAACAAMLALWSLEPAHAQQESARTHGIRSVHILKGASGPRLDGVLDDAVWTAAAPADGFLQREPIEGGTATEATEVRVVSDGKNLFFGVMCRDSEPSGILSRELRRDDPLDTDDTFAIILDTFHDHRNAFLFRINPRGAQFDALITDEGRHVNTDWREDWEVETQITDEGWSAEIKIPLKSIRFASADAGSLFGIDFERIIRRKNETTYWSNYSRNFNFHQVSQGGHLGGVDGLAAATRVRIKPFVNMQTFSRGTGDRTTEFDGEVGLEDLKYSLTPALTADLTVNTDFAQTEVDEAVVNFDRVPVFFPEKREFFLEGAGLFEFGALQGEGSPEVKLYHSRRIGLSDEGEAEPIIAGVKLAGKIGEKFTIGIVDVQTDETDLRPGDNFGVFRLQRNVLARSSVGTFFTNRQAGGDDFNRVAGLDANFVVLEHLTLRSMLARSFTGGVKNHQGVGSVGVQWEDDLINGGMDFFSVGENFRSDLGFLERVGVRKFGPHFNIAPRPQGGSIRQLSFGVRYDHYRRIADNSLETEVYHINNNIRFQDGVNIRFSPHRRTDDLREPFRLPRGLVVPPGRYSWWYYPLTYSFNPAWKLTGSVQYRYEHDYFGSGGRRHTWNVNPVFRLNQHVSARVDYALNRLQLPGGDPVNVHVANTRLDVSLNREWLTSTIFQYSNSRDLVGMNFRLRYRYGPNHDMYLVVNSVGSGPDTLREIDRSVTLKITRSFDF